MSLKELAPTYYVRLNLVTNEVDKCGNLLNVGCGDGFFDIFLKKKTTQLHSIDINRGDIEIAKILNPDENVTYHLGTIERLPFPDNFFDYVLCSEVLEHLKSDQKAISELIRVLRKGGRLVVTVPTKNFPFFYDPINYVLNRLGRKLKMGIWGWGHERLYTFSLLEKRVGLKVIKRKRFPFSLVSFFESSYTSSFLSRFVKNDPKNQDKVNLDVDKIKRSVFYKLPKILVKIRDFIIKLDNKLFLNSRKSVEIMVVFEK